MYIYTLKCEREEGSSITETSVVFRMLLSAHGSFVFISQSKD